MWVQSCSDIARKVRAFVLLYNSGVIGNVNVNVITK
jgi:hypothetical protein